MDISTELLTTKLPPEHVRTERERKREREKEREREREKQGERDHTALYDHHSHLILFISNESLGVAHISGKGNYRGYEY